jgi:hypothetical protein
MTAFSNYLENKLLGVTILGSSFTAPTTIYVGLATALSTDGDLVTEVTGGSYTRRVGTFGAPAAGQSINSGNITFPQATANWGTVTHIVLYDAASSGNVLYWAALDVARPINTNDTLVLPTGSLSITLD